MLRDRLIVGIIGAVFAVSLMIFINELVLGIVISIIALMGLTEMYNALGLFKNNIPLSIIGYIASVLILCFSNIINTSDIFLAFTCIYVLVLLVYMVLAHKHTTFADISKSFFSTLYVTLFFSYLILIRKYDKGVFLIWIPIITAWLSDTMAYTFGRLFGKHKLIPEVSPKKTVEGALGGVVGGVVFMTIYGFVCQNAFNMQVNWISVLALGALGAILSQFGDLAASWIKREQGIKDYGNLLPGHGGVMDRFDSVLVVAPFVYYFIQIFPVL